MVEYICYKPCPILPLSPTTYSQCLLLQEGQRFLSQTGTNVEMKAIGMMVSRICMRILRSAYVILHEPQIFGTKKKGKRKAKGIEAANEHKGQFNMVRIK